MKKKSGDLVRLVVVLPLLPLRLGDAFSLRDWPLHVTVAPTFVVGTELACVVEVVAHSLSAQPPLQVVAGAEEGFGHSMTIPVSVIEPNTALTAVHLSLVAVLLDLGAVFDDPEFIGLSYRAHVTWTRAEQVGTGDLLQLRQAAIVDMEPEGQARSRRVVWANALG